MPATVPGCRTVCGDKPGEVVDHLVVAFRKLRSGGLSEEQAFFVARDAVQVERLLAPDSIGALRGTAEAIVNSGCAECAVIYAYAK